MKGAVFLDRDGVISEDSPNFIKNWDEFLFIPGSLEALRLLNEAGHPVIVISNQSGIARGIIAPEDLDEMHMRMKAEIRRAGGEILDILFCPHGPDDGCRCRKPGTGLIEEAVRRCGVELHSSVMIGDSARDLFSALDAGCGKTILVRTGKGVQAEKELAAKGVQPDVTADDLLAAVRILTADDF